MKENAGKKQQLNNGFFRQRGASLTEYILYTALAGIVILGATKMYRASSTASESNQMMSDINGIRAAAQSLSTNGVYTGLSMDTLNNGKSLPSTIRKSGTNWLSNLNTNMTIAVNGAAPNKFDLTINAVPPEVCMKAIAALDASWAATVGGTAVTLPAADMNAVNTACGTTAATLVLTSS